jgi:hypothetical protein
MKKRSRTFMLSEKALALLEAESLRREMSVSELIRWIIEKHQQDSGDK